MRVPHAQTALALRCGRAAAMANQAPSVTFRSFAVLFFLVVYSHPRSVWLRPFSSAYSCSQSHLISGFGESMCTRSGLVPEAMVAADAICPERSGQSCQLALNQVQEHTYKKYRQDRVCPCIERGRAHMHTCLHGLHYYIHMIKYDQTAWSRLAGGRIKTERRAHR